MQSMQNALISWLNHLAASRYWLGFPGLSSPLLMGHGTRMCLSIALFPGGLALDVIPYLGQHFHRIQVSKPVKSHTKSVSSTVTTLENYSFSSAGFEPTSSAREPESKTTMLLRHSMRINVYIDLGNAVGLHFEKWSDCGSF